MIHRPWGFAREICGCNPSVDLYETRDSFILEADLPGVKGEDVKVQIQDGGLVLEGQRTIEKNQSSGRFIRWNDLPATSSGKCSCPSP